MSDKKEVGLVSPNVLECGIVHNLHRILIKTTKKHKTNDCQNSTACRSVKYSIIYQLLQCNTVKYSYSFYVSRKMTVLKNEVIYRLVYIKVNSSNHSLMVGPLLSSTGYMYRYSTTTLVLLNFNVYSVLRFLFNNL